jgi:hypothetical protein
VEIINTAAYLNTKYIEHKNLNIVKSHENNLPSMNSTIQAAANVTTELKQSNGTSDVNNESIEHIHLKAKLGDSLKYWKEKYRKASIL